MDGVLEGAIVVCVCKLAASALFLPVVWGSRSPVSFCCCCLLLFTDLTITLFLVALRVSEPWLAAPRPVSSDIIALRFLLFLGHTYGAALAMTTPLVAMEILTRPRCVRLEGGGEEEEEEKEEAGRPAGRTPEAPPPPADAVAVRMEGEAGGGASGGAQRGGGWKADRYQDLDMERARPPRPVPGFLCCLLAWALSGLHGSLCARRAELLRTEACVRTTGSLPRCLPGLLGLAPPSPAEPCWGLLTLALLLVLTGGWALLLRGGGVAACEETDTHGGAHAWRRRLIWSETPPPAPSTEGLVGDPGKKTLGGRSVEKSRPRDEARPSLCRHGNSSPSLLPLGCRTPPPTAGAEEEARSDTRLPSWSRRWAGRGGGPWGRGGVAAGLLLSVCLLPLSLGVNILSVRGVEAVLEWTAPRPLCAGPPCRDARLTGVSQST